MNQNQSFRKSLISIALPVTLQALLQSSFSVIDQVMIGQLGSDSIAGIGLGSKFASIYTVVLGAVSAAAGIMAAQYIGADNKKEMGRSFYMNLFFGILIAALFTLGCQLFPEQIMSVYTKDVTTCTTAADYLRIYSLSFVPMAAATMMAVLLRCMEAAVFPLVASILAVVINTALNYVMIFGKFGFPRMEVKGAAFASIIAQFVSLGVTFVFFLIQLRKKKIRLLYGGHPEKKAIVQYIGILGPILICEFMWSLGENVYAAIYGNIGTDECAAMTMTNPIQGLIIGALSGLSQAAGIMIGKSLGNNEYEKAYKDSVKLMKYGLVGSVILSVLLILTGRYYVLIYNVEAYVLSVAYQLLVVFAIVSPMKVLNMILGGGIIRSGGKTKYVMWVDLIGTWCFGVPLGLLAAFVFKLPIPLVYFILSLEEGVRLIISLVLFRKRSWMERLS